MSNKLVGRTDIACDCWHKVDSGCSPHDVLYAARIGTSAVVLILALVARITLEVSRSGY